ncbi:MAG TPA: pilus assembly protein PilP [Xanthomonadaceae bacterium]|jgi:type IV pilus assembly protein PilP|nr:pilus assembly protein PilP [Xanthomonadaceae bacterium]
MVGKRKLALRCTVVLLSVSALAGCGRGTSDLEAWVAEVKAKPARPPDPLPTMQKFETFLYNDQGLRDPFSPPIDHNGSSTGPRPDPDRRKQPLEAYPLDGLIMVGTIGGGSSIVGLVMAPDKVVHRVTPGTYLGQNEGRTISVEPDKIDVTELVPDGAGGWIERPAFIALPNQ